LWNLATGDFVDVAVINTGTGAFAARTVHSSFKALSIQPPATARASTWP
jgi:hypothetical protein